MEAVPKKRTKHVEGNGNGAMTLKRECPDRKKRGREGKEHKQRLPKAEGSPRNKKERRTYRHKKKTGMVRKKPTRQGKKTQETFSVAL